MIPVPRAYGYNHGTAVRKKSVQHAQVEARERSLRRALRLRSTVSVDSGKMLIGHGESRENERQGGQSSIQSFIPDSDRDAKWRIGSRRRRGGTSIFREFAHWETGRSRRGSPRLAKPETGDWRCREARLVGLRLGITRAEPKN